MNQAKEENLDLVQIAYKDNLPICKIMDYSKFKYEQKKKHSEMKKNQPKNVLKEIKLSARIDKHDIDIKVNRVKQLLEQNCMVKVSVAFRGRENNYREQGFKILQNFKIEGYHFSEMKMEGHIVFMTIGK